MSLPSYWFSLLLCRMISLMKPAVMLLSNLWKKLRVDSSQHTDQPTTESYRPKAQEELNRANSHESELGREFSPMGALR